MKRMLRLGYVVMFCARLFVLVLVLFPVYWMVVSSLKVPKELFVIPPRVVPTRVTLTSYKTALLLTNIPRCFANSLIIAFGTMMINVVIATLAAYSLTRFRYRGRSTLLAAMLISYLFPPVLLFLPLYLTLSFFGLTDSYLGVVLTHASFTVPFSTWLLYAYFCDIPPDMEEVAMVDGASRFTAFAKVIIPVAAPGILSTGLFAFIQSWNEFLYSSVLLTGATRKTFTLSIYDFISQYDVRWGIIMAAATLATVPVVILFITIQKYFVKGLTAGAVKG